MAMDPRMLNQAVGMPQNALQDLLDRQEVQVWLNRMYGGIANQIQQSANPTVPPPQPAQPSKLLLLEDV